MKTISKDATEPFAMPPQDAVRDGEPPRRLTLEVVIEAGDWSAAGPIEHLVDAVAAVIGSSRELDLLPGGLSTACVAFTSDAEVRRLNARFRAKDQPTNVLSFPAPPLPSKGQAGADARFLGDVVLAAETVMAEAERLGIPAAHHVQHLVVHGVLHVLGYDHEEEAQASLMEALEIRLLAALGVADPYRSNE